MDITNRDIIFIFQNKYSKIISNLKPINFKVIQETLSENENLEIYVDCDEDSYVVLTEKNENIQMLKLDSIEKITDFDRLPVVTIDLEKQILMQAFVNIESLRRTLETGYAHYFSRSRNKLWKKGETSGNTQRILEVSIDEKQKFILYQVEQKSAACHNGYYSCFYRKLNQNGKLIQLENTKILFDPENIYEKE